jgi:hypothetical protein
MRSFWSLALSKICLAVALPCFAFAQYNESESNHPKGTGMGPYLFPVNPGQPNQLAGTMGELRNTHFHGGIDIRTNNQIGVPIRATQDGYISRINVNTASYGQVVYIRHPDGKTSVYGHLDKFKGKISDDIRREQYRRKSFELDLYFKPDEYPVNKGDTIGLSGNTGASNGPHLHFEIREGNIALNPLKFGFTEIKDQIPPAAQRIALRTMDIHSRINDRFGRFEFYLTKKSSSEYVLPIPILASGRVGVELLADDRMDNSPGRCGINYIEMFADSQQVFSQYIERIDLDESRGIVALMDYKTLELRGKRFNKMYVDDGNRLDFYHARSDGILNVQQTDQSIKIVLKDESGNVSNTRFHLRHNPVVKEMVLPTNRVVTIESDLMENFLMITSRKCPDSLLTIYKGLKATSMAVTYQGANQRVYLIDLRTLQPDSVVSCAGSLNFHFKDIVPSQTDYTYYSDWADVRFPENALYDTLFLNVSHRLENGLETFTIGQRTIPLHQRVHVTLKPTVPQVPKKNLSVYRREGRGFSYLGGEWNKGKVLFSTLELGEFTFLTDSLAPSITRIRLDSQSARFRIRDGLSGISYYEANVNGQWLLMSYDYKSGILQSDRLSTKIPLKGDFELKVVDRAGNERIFKQKIL